MALGRLLPNFARPLPNSEWQGRKLLREIKFLDNQAVTRERHKIAVIYVGPGQEARDDIMANTNSSPGFQAFVGGGNHLLLKDPVVPIRFVFPALHLRCHVDDSSGQTGPLPSHHRHHMRWGRPSCRIAVI